LWREGGHTHQVFEDNEVLVKEPPKFNAKDDDEFGDHLIEIAR